MSQLLGFNLAAVGGELPPLSGSYDHLQWRDALTDTTDKPTPGQTWTFAGLSIGAPDPARHVIVAVGLYAAGGSVNIETTITIGGITAGIVNDGGTDADLRSNVVRAFMFIANVPDGTSADVVIQNDDDEILGCHIGYWTVRLSGDGASEVVKTGGSNVAQTASGVSIPAPGFGLGICIINTSSDVSNSVNQSYIEREETFAERNCVFFDKESVAGETVNVTSTWTGSNANCVIIICTWGG